MMASGKVAFSSVSTTDSYDGKDTGKFSLTLTLDDNSAEELGAKGVRLKEYENTQQRKFNSKYDVAVYNLDDSPFVGEIPRGSEVRVMYSFGPVHPQWGPSTYLSKVRVVTVAEFEAAVHEEF